MQHCGHHDSQPPALALALAQHTNGYCEEQESAIKDHLLDCLHGQEVCGWVDGVTITTQTIMIKAVQVGKVLGRPWASQ